MRIHSKFKDYYDGALAFGHDETVHYERITQSWNESSKDVPPALRTYEEHLNQLRTERSTIKRWSGNTVPFDYAYIGFCGKVYLVARPDTYNSNVFRDLPYEYTYGESKSQYFGDIETLQKLFPQVEAANQRIRHDYSKYRFPENLGVFVENDDIFIELGVPVFFIQPWRWNRENYVLNPNLKELGFYRIVEPFQAFQQLEQYLSNVLVKRDDDNPPRDEKSMVMSKGFDDKYGFRKRKPE